MEAIRYESNPILTKENVPFRVNSIFNAGAVKVKDKYLLVCRIEMPNGRSSFVMAKSSDGYNFAVADKPVLTPEDHKEYFEFVEWGIEDTRVTPLEGKFYLTYTGYSKNMPLVILTETEDFENLVIIGKLTDRRQKKDKIYG
jgi:beta-1,4-mannooligosaccharide/beta-1,4-mannosyl-N-acetylglucosamine phosphorylase